MRFTITLFLLHGLVLTAGCGGALKYDCYVQNYHQDYSLSISGDQNALSQLRLAAVNSIFVLNNDSLSRFETPAAFQKSDDGGIVIPLKRGTTLSFGKFVQADLDRLQLSFVASDGSKYGPAKFRFADTGVMYTKADDNP